MTTATKIIIFLIACLICGLLYTQENIYTSKYYHGYSKATDDPAFWHNMKLSALAICIGAAISLPVLIFLI